MPPNRPVLKGVTHGRTGLGFCRVPAGVRLYFEEVGQGYPIIFVHEFGADLGDAAPLLLQHYRCVAFNARGYEPSDVPADDAAYDYRHFADDIAAVIRSIGAERAHVVGLSMGAYAALMFGIRHADNASALVVAGCGSGAICDQRASFAIHVEEMARCFLEQGSERAAEEIGMSATLIQLLLKDSGAAGRNSSDTLASTLPMDPRAHSGSTRAHDPPCLISRPNSEE